MKLVDGSLEKTLEHLSETRPNDFPTGHSALSYFQRYDHLSQRLHADYHSQVAAGSIIADGGLLTDHGSDHINTVISRAGFLLSSHDRETEAGAGGNALSPYEVYLLLTAIHFHDLANILGRAEHEKRIDEMMDKVSQYLGDSVEKDCIRKIACVHGGKIKGNKDTISFLEKSAPINGLDVRPQLLAGILRLADELADDRSRANRILQALHVIPVESEVFHKYADCLHSVMIRPGQHNIELTFDINVDDLVKKWGKKTPKGRVSKVFLLDEIFERTMKTHLERMYCSRFMVPVVDIRAVHVRINVIKTGQQVGEELPRISFVLEEAEEQGYPPPPPNGVYDMCENLQKWDGKNKKITGTSLAKVLKKGT